MKSILVLFIGISLPLIAVSFIAVSFIAVPFAQARGFGGAHASGGYHGGGSYSGSRSGSYSGAHYSGSHEGSYSGGAYSGSHEGSYSGAHYNGSHEGSYSGYHAGGEYAGGYHAGTLDGYHAAGHVALPTDAAFGAGAVGVRTYGAGEVGVGAAGYAARRVTEPVNGNILAARGVAVRNSFNGAGRFDHGWYGAHPGAWAAAGWTAGRAWYPATWAAVGAALGWADSVDPIPYDYGTGITYQDNEVYYDDQPMATADQYYQEASTLAQSIPAPDSQSPDWMPLGVFALVHKSEDKPKFIMQLAINKSGALAGNYIDLVANTVEPIHGSVNKNNQRVAWTVGDKTTTVGETGLYNLTQEESPALIHIGKDDTQQWTLIRLKQPDAQTTEN